MANFIPYKKTNDATYCSGKNLSFNIFEPHKVIIKYSRCLSQRVGFQVPEFAQVV